jgi:hypothetical protein
MMKERNGALMVKVGVLIRKYQEAWCWTWRVAEENSIDFERNYCLLLE